MVQVKTKLEKGEQDAGHPQPGPAHVGGGRGQVRLGEGG